MTETNDNGNAKACAYRDHHEEYTALGYSCLPINGKRPWRGLTDWPQLAVSPANDATREKWAAMPRAGIGFVLGAAAGQDGDGTKLVVIGIDDDRTAIDDGPDALADAVGRLLAGAPCKVGRKGCTWLARMRADEAGSFDYSGPAGTVQLLGLGRQTVVPPSIHPDTGRPYAWTAPLVPVTDLPTITLAELDHVMQAHGYRRGGGKREGDPTRYDAAAAEMDAGEVRPDLIVSLELADGDLGDLWGRGADAEIMQRPTKAGKQRDNSGSALRLELARQMRRARYNGAEFRAAAREWEHAEGANVVTDRDLERAWADSAPQDAGAADGFGAVVDDAAGSGVAPGKPSIAERVGFRSLRDPRPAPARWMIAGIMPEARLGLIAGQSRAGKSFVALGAGAALARGEGPMKDRTFFGRLVRGRPRGVAYFAAEGGDTINERMDALAVAGLSHADIPFLMSEMTDPTLLDPAIGLAVQRSIEDFGVPLRMVFVDTVTALWRPKDEDAAGDVSELLARLSPMAAKHSVSICLVHHAGKRTAGARGSSNWTAMVDWQWNVIGGTDEETGLSSPRKLVLAKSRRGTTGLVCGFTIEDAEIGRNLETGEPETAGYAVPMLDSAAERLPKWWAEVLTAIRGGSRSRAEVKAFIAKLPVAAGGISESTLNKVVRAMVTAGRIAEAKDGMLFLSGGPVIGGDRFGVVNDIEGMTMQ